MDRNLIVSILITATLIVNCQCITSINADLNVEDLWWTQAGRSLGQTLKQCWSEASSFPTAPRITQIRNHITTLLQCLKQQTQTTLTSVLRDDVIPIAEGVELVRINASGIRRASQTHSSERDNDVSPSAWRMMVIDTLAQVFDTHAIRISMDRIPVSEGTPEARRRRKNHMMPLMVFGLVGLGMILIPMGFQFLAVLGGKALLLAKMALILTSIQGLKKVAHSNINYGLYHSAPAKPWFDRKVENVEYPYKTEEIYYNHYPDQLYEYKRHPHA